MGEEKLLALPREFVRAALPELATELCLAALDAAIGIAAESTSLAEAASKLRTISDDAALAMELTAEYAEE